MASTLALPASYRTTIAEALSNVRRPVLIWRQFQDCAGNSEAILRSPHPDVAQVVLETLAWNYHELIMAGSGEQAEAMSTEAVKNLKGEYIAVIEGAIPIGELNAAADLLMVWGNGSRSSARGAADYSYDFIETLVGCDIHSADRIVPEWQSIDVGACSWRFPRWRSGGGPRSSGNPTCSPSSPSSAPCCW